MTAEASDPSRSSEPDEPIVSWSDDASRWEARLDDGRVVGFLEVDVRDGVAVMPHTVVDPAARGRGLAARLTRAALAEARTRGLSVVPACSYVARYLDEHPEDADLLAR